MPSTTHYWTDLADLHGNEAVTKARADEFPTQLPGIGEVLGDTNLTGATTGRRDFLKFLGFGIGAATLAACETPVIKSIPYVNKPEDIVPGVANWYASTYFDGSDYASVLVKTREGRPIHIKGNPRFGINTRPAKDDKDATMSRSVVNARINSSVITLYDNQRLKGPVLKNTPATWADADKAVEAELEKAAGGGKRIVVLTNTVISPSTKAAIAKLQAKYPATGADAAAGSRVEHVQHDTISYSGVTNANLKSFGKRVMPSYDFTKADVVVSFGADFLSSWGSTTETNWQYAERRKPGNMSRHWQFEARMSMSGANADVRVMLKPSEVTQSVVALHDAVAQATGGTTVGGAGATDEVKKAAAELVAARGKSIVLCGDNNEGVQVLVNHINAMLGNYGTTIDLANHTSFNQGDDAAMAQLVKDMNSGAVGVLMMSGVNPVYSLTNAAEFKNGLAKCFSVSFSTHADETASLCNAICPDHHWLESWNDFMPKVGRYALAQPTIKNIFNTRQWQESLLQWSGDTTSYYDFIRANWEANMGSRLGGELDFGYAWNMSVHNGVYDAYTNAPEASAFVGDVSAAATAAKAAVKTGEWEVSLYEKEGIGNGLHANNPWLQELPDPISKVTWDNYVCMAPEDLIALTGVSNFRELYIGQESPAHVVKVSVNGTEVELPAIPSPGQAPKSVSIALGYGRGANGEGVGRAAVVFDNETKTLVAIGKNVYPMTAVVGGTVSYSSTGTLAATGGTYPLALSQTQMTAMDRHSIAKETTQREWAEHKATETYNAPHTLGVHEDVNGDGVIDSRDQKPTSDFNLWKDHPVEQVGHRWGMSIDLNSCTGCGACITACTSENNVPVVGKDEVRRSREMHWLRLDRYYSSDMTHAVGKAEGKGKIERFLEMEVPSRNPKVFLMPVMCQHCNHAPCETVCPVAATTHSNEGLNMMAYNRCIGTRYCANNCPYKVRRFNWFNYVTDKFADVNPAWDELGRMVLNPDVVVRSRGVIEKCSLCVQQIQGGKLAAKKEQRPVKDGDIVSACMAACGMGAITFGDLNDKDSNVTKLAADERAYHMLDEIGVKPNINYMAKVRNTEEAAHHA
ncbi:MAG: TAT-variant-translocated molybdopterin oxidoreductase [Flavobacteriales bacterium]